MILEFRREIFLVCVMKMAFGGILHYLGINLFFYRKGYFLESGGEGWGEGNWIIKLTITLIIVVIITTSLLKSFPWMVNYLHKTNLQHLQIRSDRTINYILHYFISKQTSLFAENFSQAVTQSSIASVRISSFMSEYCSLNIQGKH